MARMARSFLIGLLVSVRLWIAASSAGPVQCDVASEQPPAIPQPVHAPMVPAFGAVHPYETTAPPAPPTVAPSQIMTPASPSSNISPVVSPRVSGPTTHDTTPSSAPPAPSGLILPPPTTEVSTTAAVPTPAPSPTQTANSTSAPTSTPSFPTSTIGGATGLGSCYEPMHSGLYPLNGGDSSRVGEILDRDLQQLSERFTTLRTYHAQYFGLRIADYASKYNLKLFIGLAKFPRSDWEEIEIEAAVQGAKQHPGTIEAIIVGSEDLVQAGGDQTVDTILTRMQNIRERLRAAGVTNVMVGTAQRVNELTNPQIASDMDRLVAACDFVGVNIYPFFTTGFDPSNPVALLDAQWAQLRTRFGAAITKMRLTETGWPSAGAAPVGFPSNTPSASTQRAYFHAAAKWKPHDMAGPHFWFMAYDRRSDDAILRGTASYEQFFGVYTSDNQEKGVL